MANKQLFSIHTSGTLTNTLFVRGQRRHEKWMNRLHGNVFAGQAAWRRICNIAACTAVRLGR